MMYQTILFDLDGTLTNPAEGITKSVQYALGSFGISVSDRTQLYAFIGPPLTESFSQYYGFSQEQAEAAVAKYRERFSAVGLYENIVYDGIIECLTDLKRAGKVLAVATSKPEVFTQKILQHFDLAQYFDVVTGSELSGERTRKTDVILETLHRLGRTSLDNVVMVGDRKHDIIGAKNCGISSIGVRYGFAPAGELEKYGADIICDTVSDLQCCLLAEK